MDAGVTRALDRLRDLKIPELKHHYRELFGEESKSSNKQFLFRRIAWRLQANAEGGLSERAQQRATEIADERDLRVRAPRSFLAQPSSTPSSLAGSGPPRDWRLPAPGTLLTRRVGNRSVVVKVLADGFVARSADGFERAAGRSARLEIPNIDRGRAAPHP